MRRAAFGGVAVSWALGCLPSSSDLGEYSAGRSEPGFPEEVAEQMALPSADAPSDLDESAPTPPGSSDGSIAAASENGEVPAVPITPPGSTGAESAAAREEAPSQAEPEAPGSESSEPSVPSAAERCADGVLGAAELSCYRVAPRAATWQAARVDCEAWGGALVKIESLAEDQLVGDLVLENQWLGASDSVFENVYVWTDGAPMFFGNWGPGQPDRFPGPDCIEKRETPGRQWFDQPCENARRYVCEKAL